jgi:hypothetical protein
MTFMKNVPESPFLVSVADEVALDWSNAMDLVLATTVNHTLLMLQKLVRYDNVYIVNLIMNSVTKYYSCNIF